MRKQSHGQTKQLPSIQQKQLYPKPSVHQRAAFFCVRHGHMRCGKRKR